MYGLTSVLIPLLLIAEAPTWTKGELRGLFTRAEMAGRARDVAAKDSELANIAGQAYRVSRGVGESTDRYAQRILKKRRPDHPAVKRGTWLLALIRQFYKDTGDRAHLLSRFERERRDRIFLEKKSKQALAVAHALADAVVTKVEGVEGFISPLPVGSGNEPTKIGATAIVNRGVVTIERLDRATFIDDAPKPDAPRTRGGALRELYAAQKQFNMSAAMLGRVDRRLQKGLGFLRVFIPASVPAIYLNELVHGAKEAKMKALFIMVMDAKTGSLRELPVILSAGRSKKRRKRWDKFRCANTISMQACVNRALEARTDGGTLFYGD